MHSPETIPPAGAVLVVWDIDGTLISAPPSSALRFEDAVGWVLGRDDVAEPGPTDGGTDHGILHGLFAREGLSPDDALLLVPAASHRMDQITTDPEHLRSHRHVLPGVPEALAAVRDAGAIQSLVTGNSRHRTVAKLAAFGLDAVLDVRCGGYGDRTAKRWRLVEEARRRSGLLHFGDAESVPLESTLVVGDTIHDVAAAKRAGARAVGVATGPFGVDELRAAEADLVVCDLAAGLDDLLAFVAAAAAEAAAR